MKGVETLSAFIEANSEVIKKQVKSNAFRDMIDLICDCLTNKNQKVVISSQDLLNQRIEILK